MTLLLELNDAALTLHRDGRTLYRQPAIAAIDGNELTLGDQALGSARLHPQQTNQQYLARMNADPLARPGKQAANHADLLYRHLLALKPLVDEPLIAAAPGFLAPDQLGVLLGIAQEAGITIRSFVDTAVLMASVEPLRSSAWLVDLHATRCCLTELETTTSVARAGFEELAGAGLNSCLDGWANLLADRFVQDMRFDPLHAADTEQQLYDQLHAWARAGGQGDLAVEIRQGETTRRSQLSTAALQDKLAQRLQPIAEKVPAAAQLLVSPYSARLPGLLGALSALGLNARPLPADTLARALKVQAGALTERRLVTSLPADLIRQEAPTTEFATHALSGDRAWPLADNPFGLPQQGRLGDRVERRGRRFRLILVEEDAPSSTAQLRGSRSWPGGDA